jgi:hypothetical protein
MREFMERVDNTLHQLGEVKIDDPDVCFPVITAIREAEGSNDAGDCFSKEDVEKGLATFAPDKPFADEETLFVDEDTKKTASSSMVFHPPDPRRAPQTYGANAPCPCGKLRADGRPMKYKKCCMSTNL